MQKQRKYDQSKLIFQTFCAELSTYLVYILLILRKICILEFLEC